MTTYKLSKTSIGLMKKNISVENGEILFTQAINFLNKDCPKESCEWCKGR